MRVELNPSHLASSTFVYSVHIWFEPIRLRQRWSSVSFQHVISLRQSWPEGDGRHHQHQRGSRHLGHRCQQRHKAGRQAADGGEAGKRGRHPNHHPRGDWPLTSQLAEQPISMRAEAVNQSWAGSQSFLANHEHFEWNEHPLEGVCEAAAVELPFFL